MKTKKYWILTVVSLIAIVGSVIYADEAEKVEKLLADVATQRRALETTVRRMDFLQGVLFTDSAMTDIRVARRSSKDILEGIEEVKVLVFLPSKAEQYGLAEQVLQTDTELRLRQHGIKVIKEDKDSVTRSKSQRQEHTKRFVERLFGMYFEPQKPLELMNEPFKSLFEGWENSQKYKNGEHLTDEDMQRIEEGIRKFLQYTEQPPPPTSLYIIIRMVILEETGLAAVHVSLQVRESVILERDRFVVCTSAMTGDTMARISNRQQVRLVFIIKLPLISTLFGTRIVNAPYFSRL